MEPMSRKQAERHLRELGFTPLPDQRCFSPNFLRTFYQVAETKKGNRFLPRASFSHEVTLAKAQLGLS